jgi:hypothetical protein
MGFLLIVVSNSQMPLEAVYFYDWPAALRRCLRHKNGLLLLALPEVGKTCGTRRLRQPSDDSTPGRYPPRQHPKLAIV